MIKKKKDFDCVEMKNEIQAKIYAETKDMSIEVFSLAWSNGISPSIFRHL